MGRLTLNVLLSFCQFEREVTRERIRDKIAASKRKGLWVGGPLPLGYEMKDGKITVVEAEAEWVRLIFRRYLELSGVNALVRDLKDKDIRTKTRLRATGATHGGIPFQRGSIPGNGEPLRRRHPEEPRIFARRLEDGRMRCLQSSFEARRRGSHLRMTVTGFKSPARGRRSRRWC